MTSLFDGKIDRRNTDSEKYESRETYFGNTQAEPFWIADMDLPAPLFLTEALCTRALHPIYGYTIQSEKLFESVQWWMKHEHLLNIPREAILFTPSVVTSICIAIAALSKEDDAICYFSPVYAPFFEAIRNNNRHEIPCPLRLNAGLYDIDFELLEALFSLHRPALFLLSQPHNPGGRLWTKEELTELCNLCEKYAVTLLSDEVHGDLVFAPKRHNPLFSIPAAAGLGIIAHSIGKTFNCSGLHASFCIILDKKIRRKVAHELKKVHCNDIPLEAKIAIPAVFSPEGQNYKAALLAHLSQTIQHVCTLFAPADKLHIMVPDAGYLLWIDFREYGEAEDIMAELIGNALVILSNGDFFGPEGKGFFRLNCAHHRQMLYPAVARITDMLTKKNIP